MFSESFLNWLDSVLNPVWFAKLGYFFSSVNVLKLIYSVWNLLKDFRYFRDLFFYCLCMFSVSVPKVVVMQIILLIMNLIWKFS